MNLRPRQTQAVADLQAAYKAGKKAPILVAPTGFGKTHTAATLIRMALAKGKRVWFLAHLDQILIDTSQKLKAEGIAHSWIASGIAGDRRLPVQVVMVQTLIRRLDRYTPPDFIIVDEAHLAVANTYQEIFRWAKAGPQFWEPGGAHLLHLTATPQRLDGRGMGEVSDCIIPTCTTGDLIAEGLLAPIRYLEPERDISGKASIIGDPVEHYRTHADGRPSIGFCVSIDAAEKQAKLFASAGYRTVAIDANSDSTLRDFAKSGLQLGQLDIVFNVKLWVAGVDIPGVSCIIDQRPTNSLVDYLQGVGRGLRTHHGKRDLIYLDCVGNRSRHGDPTAERIWTLAGADQGSGRLAGNTSALRQCPACYDYSPAEVTVCRCGYDFSQNARPRRIMIVDGELREVTAEQPQESAPIEAPQWRAKSLEDLIALGRKRGHKRPELWAQHVLAAREAKENRKVNHGR